MTGVSNPWEAANGGDNLSFTATYSNEPAGMTATVAMSGSATNWPGAQTVPMTPTTGPETTHPEVEYPSGRTGSITFTLAQSADGTTDTENGKLL